MGFVVNYLVSLLVIAAVVVWAVRRRPKPGQLGIHGWHFRDGDVPVSPEMWTGKSPYLRRGAKRPPAK